MRILIILVVILHTFSVSAQDYFPVNGVQDKRHTTYTFTHANIQQSSEVLLKNATLKIRDGKVVAVGTDLAIDEKSEVVIDLKGKYIYPAFIDLDSNEIFSNGSFLKKQAEIKLSYNKSISVLENWSTEVDLIID